jgi:hypothetical protein
VGTVTVATGNLEISATSAGTVEIRGAGVNEKVSLPAGGTLPVSGLQSGNYTVKITYSDSKVEEKAAEINPSQTSKIGFTYKSAPAVQSKPATPQQTITPAAKAVPATPSAKAVAGKYKIGDIGPGGGIVFQVNGDHGMEVSKLLGKYTWENAVQKAKQYKSGGFSDWHLPTKDELNLVYENLQKAKIANMGSGWYWSSLEYDNSFAWWQNFSSGGQGHNYGKNFKNSVRAVRAF